MSNSTRTSFSEFVAQILTISVNEDPFDPLAGNTSFRSPLWRLARAVKGRRPTWTAELAWDRVNSVVTQNLRGWERWNIVGFVPGEAKLDGAVELLTADDIQLDFMRSFQKCRLPGTEDPLEAAVRLGDRYPFWPTVDHRSAGYPRFLSMCAFIPHVIGAGPRTSAIVHFFLPCRKTGRILGVRPNTISGWIDWALKDGHITVTRTYPRGVRKAREYDLGDGLKEWSDRWLGEPLHRHTGHKEIQESATTGVAGRLCVVLRGKGKPD